MYNLHFLADLLILLYKSREKPCTKVKIILKRIYGKTKFKKKPNWTVSTHKWRK